MYIFQMGWFTTSKDMIFVPFFELRKMGKDKGVHTKFYFYFREEDISGWFKKNMIICPLFQAWNYDLGTIDTGENIFD